jgi:hypothetical protein
MERLKAAGWHLAASIAVVGSLAALMLIFWYPPEHQRLLGGYTLLMIILGIDVAAGPLLTLVVFDRRKPRLKLDLAFIVLAQLAFLGYGLHTAAASRPVYLVAVQDQFHLVTANEIDQEALQDAKGSGYERLPWTGPRLVGAELPTDRELAEALMWESIGGRDVHVQPRYFVPYEAVAADVVARGGKTPEAFSRGLEPAVAKRLQQAIGDRPDGSVAVLWLIARRGSGVVLADLASGNVLATADIGIGSP